MLPGKIDRIAGYVSNKKTHKRVSAQEFIWVYIEDVEVWQQVFIQSKADLDGSCADQYRHLFKPTAVMNDEGLQRHEFFQSPQEFLFVGCIQCSIIWKPTGENICNNLIREFQLVAGIQKCRRLSHATQVCFGVQYRRGMRVWLSKIVIDNNNQEYNNANNTDHVCFRGIFGIGVLLRTDRFNDLLLFGRWQTDNFRRQLSRTLPKYGCILRHYCPLTRSFSFPVLQRNPGV